MHGGFESRQVTDLLKRDRRSSSPLRVQQRYCQFHGYREIEGLPVAQNHRSNANHFAAGIQDWGTTRPMRNRGSDLQQLILPRRLSTLSRHNTVRQRTLQSERTADYCDMISGLDILTVA